MKKRIFEIDFLRGILILLMVGEHILYFIYRYVFLQNWNYEKTPNFLYQLSILAHDFLYESTVRIVLQFIAWLLFFTISGISSTFSKNNLKRGSKILFFFLIMYIISAIARYNTYLLIVIDYGIFLVYAFCILSYYFISKIPKDITICVFIILSILTPIFIILIPDFHINILTYIGLSNKLNINYISDFNLFPTLTCFYLGVLIGKIFYKEKEGYLNKYYNNKVLTFISNAGRNSMHVYIGHIIILPIFFITVMILLGG